MAAHEDVARLREQARAVIAEVKRMREMIENSDIDEEELRADDIIAIAAVELCRLTAQLVGRPTKMYEMIYAADNPEFEVSRKAHGADLYDKKGNAVEHKHSICTRRGNKCNVNFSIPKHGHPEAARTREALVSSIDEKTRGGGLCINIVDGCNRPLRDYYLGHRFCVEYFRRVRIGKSDRHNMGCKRCRACGGFHRIEKFVRASEQMERGDDVDWDHVFGETSTTCSGSIS